MRIAILNRYPGHAEYTASVIAALHQIGHRVVLFAPSSQEVCGADELVPVDPSVAALDYTAHRAPRRLFESWVDRRRQWRLRDRARRGEIDALVDVGAHRALWVVPRRLGVPVVHVFHHSQPLDPTSKRTAPAKMACALRRWRVRRLAGGGHRFVVHTDRARDVLQDACGSRGASVVRVTLPALIEPGAPPERTPSSPPRLLFVGRPWPGKNFELLVDAVGRLPDPTELVVRSDLVTPGLDRSGDCRVTWVTDRVDSDAYRALFHDADLVVCPYGLAYARNGPASQVVADALALGTPVLVTSPLAELLPEVYDGAVVVGPDDLDALVEGLAEALRSLDALRSSAATDGPRHAQGDASLESYGRHLADLIAASPVDRAG